VVAVVSAPVAVGALDDAAAVAAVQAALDAVAAAAGSAP
jgi:hypothetical protein